MAWASSAGSAAALRLARFNTQAGSADKQFFQGLPSPAAAALIAAMVWVGDSYGIDDGTSVALLVFPLTLLAGILMVSNIRYHSFKKIDLRGRVPFFAVLIVVLVLVFVAQDPPLILFVLSLGYALSGPIVTLLLLKRHREARRTREEAGTSGQPEP